MSKKETETSPPEEVVSPVDEAIASPPKNLVGDYAVVTAENGLWVGSTRAHSKGDFVPVSNVEKYGWHNEVQPIQ